MNRLNPTARQSAPLGSLVLPLSLFILMVTLFTVGIAAIGTTTDQEEMKGLDRAVHHAVIHCYAAEGHYPQSVADMESRYGITYDHAKYRINYSVFATNVMPTITIVKVGGTP